MSYASDSPRIENRGMRSVRVVGTSSTEGALRDSKSGKKSMQCCWFSILKQWLKPAQLVNETARSESELDLV